MAKLNEEVLLPMSLQGVSVYRMKGVDRLVVRRKGGPGAKAIKKGSHFIRTREHNAEFGSAARAAGHLRRTLGPLTGIVNGNSMPALISLCWKILRQDSVHKRGEREVQFSKHRALLEGIQLNATAAFDAVLKCPITCTLRKSKASVTVHVPALVKRKNLVLPKGFACYRLVFTLGLLQDNPTSRSNYPEHTVSPWTKCSSGMPARNYTLKLPASRNLTANSSLLIGIGMEMSMDGEDAVRGVGAGRVLRVG